MPTPQAIYDSNLKLLTEMEQHLQVISENDLGVLQVMLVDAIRNNYYFKAVSTHRPSTYLGLLTHSLTPQLPFQRLKIYFEELRQTTGRDTDDDAQQAMLIIDALTALDRKPASSPTKNLQSFHCTVTHAPCADLLVAALSQRFSLRDPGPIKVAGPSFRRNNGAY